jgi:hypothetical protein
MKPLLDQGLPRSTVRHLAGMDIASPPFSHLHSGG